MDTCEEHPLTPDEFENFLHQRVWSIPWYSWKGRRCLTVSVIGGFCEAKSTAWSCSGGCYAIDVSEAFFFVNRNLHSHAKISIKLTRLESLQQNAQHPDTFAPHVISLKSSVYKSMVVAFNLPYRSIESTTAVGPIFYAAWDQDERTPHLRNVWPFYHYSSYLTYTLEIVYRKSDVRKKGFTRGWELTLSHDVNNGITTGFCKGTPSSDIAECIKHLRACVKQVGHPMLLPVIIFSHEVSFKTDIKQRDARDWLRRLEHAVSMRSEIQEKEGYVKEGFVDLDAVNRDLVECHSQVLWKRPKAYLEILVAFELAMKKFYEKLPEERKDEAMRKLHSSMLSRLEFYRVKLQGIANYAHTTLQRLDIQRSAVSFLPGVLRAKVLTKEAV